ncbi:hypothetical protein COCOBI_18-2550 [Coccomyxa sp. Obi]|nr:hypothetical protein COCOBI_18-2550 [Coccomyxa sp. Obi]
MMKELGDSARSDHEKATPRPGLAGLAAQPGAVGRPKGKEGEQRDTFERLHLLEPRRRGATGPFVTAWRLRAAHEYSWRCRD